MYVLPRCRDAIPSSQDLLPHVNGWGNDEHPPTLAQVFGIENNRADVRDSGAIGLRGLILHALPNGVVYVGLRSRYTTSTH